MSDASIRVSSEGLECTAFSPSDSEEELQRRPSVPGSRISKDNCAVIFMLHTDSSHAESG